MKAKRIFSIALCLAMLATLLPAPALAADDGSVNYAAFYDAATGRLKYVTSGVDDEAFDEMTEDTEVKLFRLDQSSYAPQGVAHRVLSTTELALSRGEDGQTVITLGKEKLNRIEYVVFKNPVTLTFDTAGVDADIDWLDNFHFSNCEFAGGLTVVALADKSYGVDFSDSCTGDVTTALPTGVTDAGVLDHNLQLNNLRGIGGVTANTRTEINGGDGWDGTVTQSGEEAIAVHAVDRYSIQANWWKEEDNTRHNLGVHNFVYQYNEETGRHDNLGASENVLTLGSEAAYSGEMTVSGNVDYSAIELGDGARVFVQKGHGKPSTIRFGGNALYFEDNFDEDCALFGTGTVELSRPCNSRVTLNGVTIGNAHVFGAEYPYGVYLGQAEDLTDVSCAVYPGWWNGSSPDFPDEPVDSAVYEKEDNDGGGCNLQLREDTDDSTWVHDPYQVKLVMTYPNGAVVIYNTLWYKEGQMSINDFAKRARDLLGSNAAAEMDETDLSALAEQGWTEDDYDNDDPGSFAFAVKYGGLLHAQDDDDQSGDYWLTHCWSAWDNVRYGTAKAILENAYIAAWHDDEYKSLPDSVKLTDENGQEWHGDHDEISHQDVNILLERYEIILPQDEIGETVTITLYSEDSYSMQVGSGEPQMIESDTLSGKSFSNAVTLVSRLKPLGEDGDYGGMFFFRNCTFDGGLTVYRSAQTGFNLDFGDSCTGVITVTAAEDEAADFVNEEGEDVGKWVGLYCVDGMTIHAETNAVCLNNFGRRIATVNGLVIEVTEDAGVDIFADRGEVRIAADQHWDENGEPCDVVRVTNAKDENDKEIAYTGSLGVVGNVDVSSLQMADDNHRLYLWQYVDEHQDIRRLQSFVKLGANLIVIPEAVWVDEGGGYDREFDGRQRFETDGGTILLGGARSWRMNLIVNGWEMNDRPVIRWHDGETDSERFWALYYPTGLTIDWLGNGEITEPIELEPIAENEEQYVTGEWLTDENGEVCRNINVIFTGGSEEQENRFSLVYVPALLDFESPVSIGEFGDSLLNALRGRDAGDLRIAGEASVEDYLADEVSEAIDEAVSALFNAIWPRDDEEGWSNWGDAPWRLRNAFVFEALMQEHGGTESDDIEWLRARYGDPGDDIRYDDTLTLLALAWRTLGRTDALPDSMVLYMYDEETEQDVPRSGDALGWGFCRGEKDDLLDRLNRALDGVSTVEGLVAALRNGGEVNVVDDVTLESEEPYVLTVPAGTDLRIERGVTLTVGANVTLALEDGTALDENGDPAALDEAEWRTNEWGDHYVSNNGAALVIDGGTLKIEKGGAVSAGRWSNIHNNNDGTVEVLGELDLASGKERITGYWIDGFQAGDWDDERGGDGWIDQSDAVQFHNNGELRIGTEENKTGTLRIGQYANLNNNWDDRGTETAEDDVAYRVTVDGTIELAGSINNGGDFTLYSAGKIIAVSENARISNNVDERWEDGADEPYFTHAGSMDLSGGEIVMERDDTVLELERPSAFTLNGLTFTPAEGYSFLRVIREPSERTSYTLTVENGGDTLTITGDDWANDLYLYGDVNADGVACNGGYVVNRTAFVRTGEELAQLVSEVNAKTGVRDVIIVGDVELEADITLPECYYVIAEGASLTVPEGVTLTFAGGTMLDKDGEPIVPTVDDLANLWWRENDDGSYSVANTGSYVAIYGTLTVNGTLALGKFAFLSNNGEMTVNGEVTFADATFFFEGHKNDKDIVLDGNSNGAGGFTLTDAAGMFNGGTLTINGTLTGGTSGYIGNNREIHIGTGGTLTNQGMFSNMGALNNHGTVNNNALCFVSGQVENEGVWTQSGKLTLSGYGYFGQYLTGTLIFEDDKEDKAVIETSGDGTFYVVVREDADYDEENELLTAKGTISAIPQEPLDDFKAHTGIDDHVKTMALVLSANGIAAASEKEFNDCILVPQYDSKTVLNSSVTFDEVGFADVTLQLGDGVILAAGELIGDGTIIAASRDQVVCDSIDPGMTIRITETE